MNISEINTNTFNIDGSITNDTSELKVIFDSVNKLWGFEIKPNETIEITKTNCAIRDLK